MEENKTTPTVEQIREQEDRSFFNFRSLFETFILNWQWFALSLIICLGVTAIYLRYATPRYQQVAKILIKDEENRGNRSTLASMTNLGIMSNSEGIDNEMEIFSSHIIAADVVRDLKLYVNYKKKGRVKDIILYKDQPITVDIDEEHLDKLSSPISITIECVEKNKYKINYRCYGTDEDGNLTGPYTNPNEVIFTRESLPQTLRTKAGTLTFSNNGKRSLSVGGIMFVTIQSPYQASYKYQNAFRVTPTSKNTTIVRTTITDEVPQRGLDYLRQIVICYNRQANEDKNEVAYRTEEFINTRLEKISDELGETEGQLER